MGTAIRSFRLVYGQRGCCARLRIRAARFLFLLCILVLMNACTFPGQQRSQPDPRLKLFHVLSTRIITMDTQAEVDGTIINTGKTRFPFDVTLEATFYDLSNHVVGQALGVAEDVGPGMMRSFTLMGQVDSAKYSHMSVTPISLRERRTEKNLPSPPPMQP